MPRKRRVCFVTGTRAEFGLMDSTLRAIRQHPALQLQIVVTGMHLDRRHGRSIDDIAHRIDAKVPWRAGKGTGVELAQGTGRAMTLLAETFNRLRSDIVLVVGDRAEAFAAASAAHLAGRIVAHVHGGDRALGQVDDSLRHAITKLSHIHFAATKQSALRIKMLGEDPWRIHTVGAPGIDGIANATAATASSLGEHKGQDSQARRRKGQEGHFALLALHPIESDDGVERAHAELLLSALKSIPFARIVIIHPNNDPGSRGIARCWDEHTADSTLQIHRNLDRARFLRLLRDAAVLVGNSSSGIIEAASFGTPAIDIGPRQLGRERSQNVTNVPYRKAPLLQALNAIWNQGKPRRFGGANIYGGTGAGLKIANVLSSVALSDRLRRKLIAY